MLNREDIRKVLEAHSKVVNQFKSEGKEIEDISPKVLFDNILGELNIQEKQANKSNKDKEEQKENDKCV